MKIAWYAVDIGLYGGKRARKLARLGRGLAGQPPHVRPTVRPAVIECWANSASNSAAADAEHTL